MSDDTRDTLPTETDNNAPLPNRITRGTLTGCLGILCVFALPILLFLPLENLRAPLWLSRLIPLIAVAITALGAWLLAHVPAGSAPRSDDPQHPLTSAGVPPVIDHPAGRANRIGFSIAVALVTLCLIGYGLVSLDTGDGRRLLGGTLVTSGAGCALLAYGLLTIRRQAPIPAWHWVRIPIQGGLVSQAIPFTLLGLIAVVWALLLAAGAGYIWAPVGIGLLILGGALAGPVMQRLPRSRSWRSGQ